MTDRPARRDLEIRVQPDPAGLRVHVTGAMADSELRHVRIAHVKPRGLDAVEFCELHAEDAGFDARVFIREDEASRWLRFGETDPLATRAREGGPTPAGRGDAAQ